MLLVQVRFALVLFCVCSVFIGESRAELNYRLGGEVLPSSYDVTIKPYLLAADGQRQFTFDGEVNITLHARVAGVRHITLHKDYIDVEQVKLLNTAGQAIETIAVDSLSYEAATDQLTVPLQEVLVANTNYTLYVKYTGQIRNGLAGFFRANYTDLQGNEKWIGVTQMQRIDARCVFPCFDEPSFKASFRMHISRPRDYNSVFNTALLSSQPDGEDRYLDHFDWTPVMSTYLVAFIVSDFVKRGDGDVSVFVRSEYAPQTSYALDAASRTVDAYGQRFGMTYKELGNPILQNAGSPKFPHNGMENWGLVIYKDEVLVHRPGYTDGWEDKQYTLTILVHEIAHMWFGNSVTFEWWSYFWLNEAFARYYQYFQAHKLNPEFGLDEQFTVLQMHLIFNTDAVNTTQPMTTAAELVSTPSEIASKFSSIAYAKGACVVRMISNLMGEVNFDQAIQEYLRENHLRSTRPDDLFQHLERHWWQSEPAMNLTEFFHDWTEKVGYPMVTVSKTAGGLVTFEQRRFLLDPSDGSDPDLRYTIPITYTTNLERDYDRLQPRLLLRNYQSLEAVVMDSKTQWLVVNLQQANYYRVYYEGNLLARLTAAMSQAGHSDIPVNNRAQIIDDAFTFARVGIRSYTWVFSHLEYLAYEMEYSPWYATFNHLPRVVQRMSLEVLPDFRRFLFDVTERVFNATGLRADASQDTNALDVYKRNKLVSWLCKYGHEECNREAQRLFAEALSSGVAPSTDYRETIYCAAVRNGSLADYEHLAQLFAAESYTAEREMLVRAMGCTTHHMEHHYQLVLSDAIPEYFKELALTVMYSKNPENVLPAFRLMTETVEQLQMALGSWSATAYVLSGVADYFTTPEEKRLLEQFISDKGHLFGDSVSVLEAAVVTVEKNLLFAEERLSGVFQYLFYRSGAFASKPVAFISILLVALHAVVYRMFSRA